MTTPNAPIPTAPIKPVAPKTLTSRAKSPKTSPKRVAAKTPAKRAPKGRTMTVVQIAGALKIDPKVARAKLRRNVAKLSIAPENGRWPMVAEGSKTYKEVVSILKPAKA